MRKKFFWLGMLLIYSICGILMFLNSNQEIGTGKTVLADANTENCVCDEAGLLNKETVDKNNEINRYTLSEVKGHPQIAVFMTEKMDDSMSDYTQRLFDKYKFCTKSYNNGILILINKQDNHRVWYGADLA